MQSSLPSPDRQGGTLNKIYKARNKVDKVKDAAFFIVGPSLATQPVWGNTTYDQVTEEERVEAFVYKMDKPWLQPNELRVQIRQGDALWVIGQGDETIRVKLRRNHKMRLSQATASMSSDGVLTVVIPKRYRARKWYEYKDVALNKFKTVHVGISWS